MLRPNAWPKILENENECVLLDIGDGKKFPLPSGYGTLLLSYQYKCLHFAIHCWRWFHFVHLGLLQKISTPTFNPVKFVS